MENVNIQGVPETMLQTLFARAAHSQKKEHKFYDQKAVKIVKQLDYDVSKAEQDAAMSSGVIARTILLDRMVGAFLEEKSLDFFGSLETALRFVQRTFFTLDNSL